MSSRLKREDCKCTKHDSVFSKWEILIGPSDWEDHSLGKDGAERYRSHNLPNGGLCPGLYELGATAVPTDEGRKLRKHDSENIVVVYLGQTDNVRTRLQQYGRVGAHLDRGNLIASLNKNGSPGLFKEIFSRGYSIMFRWAPMTDKKEAEKIEAELLSVFDYAWNRRGNGACRRDDILAKLDSKPASPIHTVLRKLQPWKHPAFSKKEGIKINASVPLEDHKGFLLPQVLKFGKAQFRFVHREDSFQEDLDICGVATGDGSVCRNRPIFGRKRCEEHKGKKIIETNSVVRSGIIVTQENPTVCGVVLEDGSLCAKLPANGRKICELHKGRRVSGSELHIKPDTRLFDHLQNPFWKCQPRPVQGEVKNDTEFDICGVVYADGSVCRNRPIFGRKRCEGHKGQRITGTTLKLTASGEGWESKEDDNSCGVVTREGYVCRRKPVLGRKRCEEHKGQRISGPVLTTNIKGSGERGNLFVCGVGLGDGSICRKLPVPGRKRCEVHKGRRVT